MNTVPAAARRTPVSAATRAMSELFPGSEFDVVSEMHRRHSEIYVLRSEEQGLYVAKFEAGWSKSVLEVVTSNARVLHGVLATEGARLDVVRVVGQTQDPPGLIMEYVAGVNLDSLIARAVLCSATPNDRKKSARVGRSRWFSLGDNPLRGRSGAARNDSPRSGTTAIQVAEVLGERR